MPLTALSGNSSGKVTIGDVSLGLFPEILHPNVMAYVAAQNANGYSPSRSRVDALNNLVWGLVGMGLWDKLVAIYPFLGGTTGNTHKWNLKDLRDLDAAYRITWTGAASITFSEFGIQNTSGTGTVYGNTFFAPGTPVAPVTTSNIHISAYANIGATATGGYFGATTAANAGATQIVRVGAGVLGGNANLQNLNYISAGANFTGFFQPVRTAANVSAFYRNGVSVGTSAGGIALPTSNLLLLNRGGSLVPSNVRLAFASIGTSMTPQQAKEFYILVQSYQRALGRQV